MKRLLVISLALMAAFAACGRMEEPSTEPEPQQPQPEEPAKDTLNTGLPVIRLRTLNTAPILSKDIWIDGEMDVVGGELFGSADSLLCKVRGRGNTTWSWPKKPYALKLDSKAALLGMPKHKRWVLLANFMDRTMMRNIVTMKVGSLTSLDWTPRCQSVELVLNGAHRGNYLLIEQVKADSKRVPVDEDNGYLLELDYHDDNEVQWVSPYGQSYNAACVLRKGIPFGIKNPDPEVITDAQAAWIKNHIDSVASVLYGPSGSLSGNGLDQYIDYTSFADYFIVFELMINGELSNPGSVYFHLNPGEKIKAGPLWDFDWGTLSYNCYPAAKSSFINKEGVWVDKLLTNPDFVAVLKNRWSDLKPSLETVPAFIDSTKAVLEASAEKNFQKWNPAEDSNFNSGNIINGDENMSYSAAVDRLKKIYSERLATLSNIIGKL